MNNCFRQNLVALVRKWTLVLICTVFAGACGVGARDVVLSTGVVPSTGGVPGTGQTACYSNNAQIACPAAGQDFFGQDANAPGPAPRYTDNSDGTVTDELTGLTWTKALYGKTTWAAAASDAAKLNNGESTGWRLPSVKELYTLINFNGRFGVDAAGSRPFIDTRYFDFSYLPDLPGAPGTPGQRFLDVQLWTSTEYVSTTMGQDATVFGVNFADGRIKGYPKFQPGSGQQVPATMFVRYVRGPVYGGNKLNDNGDGTVTDRNYRLLWQAVDDGVPRNWKDALRYCAQLNLGNTSGWRLPNAKELHTIVDYTRSPATGQGAAIAPPLRTSVVESYFWSSTTLLDGPPDVEASKAVYFAFGRALGWMPVPPGSNTKQLIDVHGAGSQRADPKAGDPARFPQGFGPQGDDVRINNYVRCVKRET